MKCAKCRYIQRSIYGYGCCELTRAVVNPEKEHECPYHNKDLSGYDICYNCRYYGGGGDWGLFCSHPEQYHHLGKFDDEPCRYYVR